MIAVKPSSFLTQNMQYINLESLPKPIHNDFTVWRQTILLVNGETLESESVKRTAHKVISLTNVEVPFYSTASSNHKK